VADLGELEAVVGHPFVDRELLVQAMRHASWCNQQTPRPPSNQRLEFLGDAVLQLVVGHRVFVRFPQHHEGDLSFTRQQVVREDALADAAREIGLGEHLLLDHNLAVNQGGRDRPRILADALEAVFGAVYLDGGLAAAERAVDRVLGARIATVGPGDARDAKTRLQQLVLARGQSTPVYRVVAAQESGAATSYEIAVVIGDDELGRGSGTSQQLASQRAAQQALDKLAP
jgi:ribonuclease-3